MTIKVHIHSNYEYMDDSVYIEVRTKTLPCVGDHFHLREKDERILEKQAKTVYFKYGQYMQDGIISFFNCTEVRERLFSRIDNSIHISLGEKNK